MSPPKVEGRPVVQVLYFAGCPHHEAAASLVHQVGGELGLAPDVELVEIKDHQEAERQRFLGSPTVRVGGRDVEPGADERTDYGLGCRVFRVRDSFTTQPDAAWIRCALRSAKPTSVVIYV